MEKNDLKSIDEDLKDPDIEYKEELTNEQVEQIEDANNVGENKISSDGSILTSNYEDLPPLESDEEIAENAKDENSIHVNYSFNGDDVIEGLTTMQEVLLFKKNMIYTGILSLVFAVYMIDYQNIQSLVLGLLSLVVIGVIWIMPKIHIKRFAKMADENKINLSIDIYSSFIKVVNNQKTISLSFEKQINNIIETKNLFVVCSGKERVFIIPKRCIDTNIIEFIREIFVLAMGDKYHLKDL